MISTGEVQRISGILGLPPTVVDHDYVLGTYLSFLAVQPEVHRSWVFKGGTSLQKCHFGDYRFSEDLDFTILEPITADGLKTIADRAKASMQDSIGIRTDEEGTKIDVIDDDYGRESFEVKIYYRGPWNYGGSARSLQIHLSRDELLVFPAQQKAIIHRYSDSQILPKVSLHVYSLEEILVEKLRAFSGQRKHAIARDIFDLYFLSTHGVDEAGAIAAVDAKFRFKGIDLEALAIDVVEARKEDFRANWNNNLAYLLPDQLRVPFERAWDLSIALLKRALKKEDRRSK